MHLRAIEEEQRGLVSDTVAPGQMPCLPCGSTAPVTHLAQDVAKAVDQPVFAADAMPDTSLLLRHDRALTDIPNVESRPGGPPKNIHEGTHAGSWPGR
ncbi:hypothetical protein D9M69_443870 [compost metagenome]|jgi:hypothetical protein|uniref:Uncharacterized protein n=1 Tax=Cupriavidus oxalaticus TaxID=96344 RepID=A0A5P3VHV7_9BURK|nr:hypothetical protein D2917_09395 [Cupriavidus oxalaticus]